MFSKEVCLVSGACLCFPECTVECQVILIAVSSRSVAECVKSLTLCLSAWWPNATLIRVRCDSLCLIIRLGCVHAGTIAYMSPELLQHGKLTKLNDVYSFAMLLIELWNGKRLFQGLSQQQARALPP